MVKLQLIFHCSYATLYCGIRIKVELNDIQKSKDISYNFALRENKVFQWITKTNVISKTKQKVFLSAQINEIWDTQYN